MLRGATRGDFLRGGLLEHYEAFTNAIGAWTLPPLRLHLFPCHKGLEWQSEAGFAREKTRPPQSGGSREKEKEHVKFT